MEKDVVKVENFNTMEFLKKLKIPTEEKKKLLLGIAAIMVNVGEDTTKMATAACMGLPTNDEKFMAFYNNDIRPIVKLDIQKIYDQLSAMVLTEEEDNNEELNEEQKFIIEVSRRFGCDSDGDFIRRGDDLFYINAQKSVLEKVEQE